MKKTEHYSLVIYLLLLSTATHAIEMSHLVPAQNGVFKFADAMNNKDICVKAIQRFVPYFMQMRVEVEREHPINNSQIKALTQLTPQNCASPELRKEAISTITNALNQNSGRIGVLLLKTAKGDGSGANFISGLTKGMAEEGLNAPSLMEVRYVDAQDLKLNLADLVIEKQVATLVMNLGRAQSAIVADWAEKLQIPSVVADDLHLDSLTQKYATVVFPSQQKLAFSLVVQARKQGYQNIGIVRLYDQQNRELVDQFKFAMDRLHIKSSTEVSYYRHDFASLDAAIQKMLIMSAPANETTGSDLSQNKPETQQSGFKDEAMATLQARLAVDAIFIPDDFSAVKTVLKMFEYYGIKNIPLLGAHRWRSSELFALNKGSLNKAFFGDFVGLYSDLPETIAPGGLANKFVLKADEASDLDFKLIGYRSGMLVGATYRPGKTRKQIAKSIIDLRNSDQKTVEPSTDFKSRLTQWPTYLFSINQNELIPVR